MGKKKKGPAAPRGGNAARGLSLQEKLALFASDGAGEALLAKAAAQTKAEEGKANRAPDRNPMPHTTAGKNWSSDDTTRFINPYNFISFNAQTTPKRKKPEKGTLTGWLDCTITTQTPLIIPDVDKAMLAEGAVGGAEKDHKTIPFFTLPDTKGQLRPAIPGSTLRGAIRALYESASGSCLPIDSGDDITLSTRLEVGGSAKTRALLCYDKAEDTWSLHAVQHDPRDFNQKSQQYELGFRLADKTFRLQSDGTLTLKGYDTSFTAGQTIHFCTEPGTRELDNHRGIAPCTNAIPVAEGGQEGYLQFVAPMGNKRFSPRVIARDSSKPPLQTWGAGDDTPATEIAKVLAFYAENAQASTGKNTNAIPYKYLASALDNVRKMGGCLPVWVLEVTAAGGGVERYLTCSSVGRIIMRNDWAKLLGAFQSCDDMQKLCPACRLFGNARKKVNGVGTTTETSYAGHLRFGDALQALDCKAKLLPMRTLPELAGPKPSAAVFYSHRPSPAASSWNYDYYTINQGKSNEAKVAIDSAESKRMLLGRKGYWHHTPAPNAANTMTTTATHRAINSTGTQELHTEKQTKRNCTMQPMDAGARFGFKLYFEQITQQQLDELIWVCTLGENRSDSNRQQKIGHAKPLGYGSVKITVDALHTRTLEAQGETLAYKIATSDYTQTSHKTIPCPFDEASQTMQELLALCDATKTQNVEHTTVCYPLGSAGDSGKANDNAAHQWFAGNKNFYEKCYVMPAPIDEVLHLPRIYKEQRKQW